MESNCDYLSYYSLEQADQEIFKIKKPSWSKRLLYYSFIILGIFGPAIIPWLLFITILATILIIFLVPRIWNSVSKRLIKENISQALDEYAKHKGKKDTSQAVASTINSVIGLKIDFAKTYYLEGSFQPLDLNDVKKFFSSRVLDVISACVGTTFIIGTLITWIPSFDADETSIWGILLIIANFTPFLISWLVPIVWTLEDSGIRAIDDQHRVHMIGSEMRKGIFSKILGTGGLILGYTFLTSHSEIYRQEAVMSTAVVYIIAGAILFLMILFISGPSVLVTWIYLNKYHEANVNECRTAMKARLPIGLTAVIKAKSNSAAIPGSNN